MKFISNTKNPYETLVNKEKNENINKKFTPKSKVGITNIFKNNTSNITGKKAKFLFVRNNENCE